MKQAIATMNIANSTSNWDEGTSASSKLQAYRDPLIEIVIPVLNEETILENSIRTLDNFMSSNLPYRYRITIADNGSSDGTQIIARKLSESLQTVRTVRLDQRGRGRALKLTWQESPADILTYMDVDLSTGLDAFVPMIQPLVDGEAGMAIASRLAKGSRTTRSLKREFISRSYNKLIKFSSGSKISDAQCGFKAIRKDVAKVYIPRIKDNEWFFDTELLIKLQHGGEIIHEQPVTWIEDTDSRVKIIKTAIDDIKGLHRVSKELDDRTMIEKFALPLILLATGAIYLFGALHNGMANSYYSAAVQAASTNWTAWLFGSLDAANYISVDKPPIATMVMGLSSRIFGFSTFSMLLPNVLAGVGSVWLLYASVKRQFGFKSAIIAAITLALTPVAALMFGFNNPDAILTFLLTASGYAFLRSLENKKPMIWLGIAGLLTGLAFNTKMLQGMMVLPVMVLAYLIFAKPPIITRILHLLFAGVITTVSTLWWSVLVWLTPASSRPWVGSTSDNNIWSLIFGYNGFGRLFGTSSNRGGGAAAGGAGIQSTTSALGAQAPPPTAGMTGGGSPGGTGFGGSTGITRMFNSDFGPNIGWLLGFALLGGGLMLWILRKTPRTNRGRASVVFWLLWLLVHIVIFSMTSGIIHPYYVIVMAPAVAALVGISLPFMWGAYQRHKAYSIALPLSVALTAVIASVLLGYTNSFPWLTWVVLVSALIGIAGFVVNYIKASRLMVVIGIVGSLIACMASPVVYTISTVSVSHTGSIPTSGPDATAMVGSNNESSVADNDLVAYLLANRDNATWIVAVASANESAAIQISSGQPVMALGGFNGADSPLTLAAFKQLVATGKLKYYAVSSPTNSKGGRGSSDSEISSWVLSSGTKIDYGGSGVSLYRLDA